MCEQIRQDNAALENETKMNEIHIRVFFSVLKLQTV